MPRLRRQALSAFGHEVTAVGTQIHIEIIGGPAHTSTFSRTLSPEEQRRVLQALCNFGRTLQLWLEESNDPISPEFQEKQAI
jgi:hypothetical protein